MWKSWFIGVVAAALAHTVPAADLTDTEKRWLQGAWPVVTWAKAEKLPLDIVVQPQPAPDAAPLATAYVGGRCKLVLSMRGNAEADATLARIEPELLDATLELMAAHELGHCRRHLDGAWMGAPAGFTARAPAGLPEALRDAYAAMQASRREEGYADLVALAWTRQHHPAQYARLHAWLVAERSKNRIEGSHHDTLAWIASVADAALSGATIFAAADALWPQGLAAQP